MQEIRISPVMAVNSASSPGGRIFSCRFREQISAQKIGGSSEPQPGAERVLDQAATIGADQAADLVAHEGKALDQRPDCGSNVTNTTSIFS